MKEYIKNWIKNHKELSRTLIIVIIIGFIGLLIIWNGSRLNYNRALNNCTNDCVYVKNCGVGNFQTDNFSWCYMPLKSLEAGFPFPTQDSCIKSCMNQTY